MKKVFISFLIMTLTLANMSLVNISSVQAATTDTSSTDNTIKVSLENIRDIMIENNLDIKITNNALKIAKEKRDDAKDTYDGATKPTKAEYTDSDGVYDSTGYDADLKVYNNAQSDYDTAKNNYKTAKTEYDQKVESKVCDAQTAYLTYLSDLDTKKINEDTLKINEKEAQVYKLQYESGFISKNTYINNLQKNTSVNDSNESKNGEELDRIKLCNLLGISPEEKIIINTDVTEDFQIISKINYDNDLAQMLDNNIEIKDQNDEIDNLDDTEDDYTNDDIYDYTVDNAEIKLKQLMNDTEISFKAQYNDLMTSYNSIKSSYDQIIQKQKEYEITQTKYNYGFISKNGVDGLDTAKLTLDKANAQFIKDRNACYLKYLKYIEMKEGY